MEFSTPSDLLNGINIFEKAVTSGKTCLKKICKIKNMFLENKRENNNKWDLNKYADIKMIVLMVDDTFKLSMFVEVQWLLSFMKHAKSLGHGLYEIERNSQFVNDIQSVLTIKKQDAETELFSLAAQNKEEELNRFLLSNNGDVDITKIDATTGKNIFHHLTYRVHCTKALKLLISNLKYEIENGNLPSTAVEDCFNLECKETYLTPLTIAFDSVDMPVKNFREMLKIEKLNVNHWNSKERQPVPLVKAYESQDKEVVDMFLYDNRVDLNMVGPEGRMPLWDAFDTIDYNVVKYVHSKTNIDMNHTNEAVDDANVLHQVVGVGLRRSAGLYPKWKKKGIKWDIFGEKESKLLYDYDDGKQEREKETKDDKELEETDDEDADDQVVINSDRYKIIKLIVNDPRIVVINATDGSDTTPLYHACQNGLPLPCIKLLCETKYGPKKDIECKMDVAGALSAFAVAGGVNNFKLLKYLFEKYPNLNVNGKEYDEEGTVLHTFMRSLGSVIKIDKKEEKIPTKKKMKEYKECLQWILQLPNIDVNLLDLGDRTALDVGLESELNIYSLELVKLSIF